MMGAGAWVGVRDTEQYCGHCVRAMLQAGPVPGITKVDEAHNVAGVGDHSILPVAVDV